jgi:hypothetical protein
VCDVIGGRIRATRSGYDFLLEGAVAGSETPRRFNGSMSLAPVDETRTRAGRPPYDVIELVPQTITYTDGSSGDIWKIELTCKRNGNLVCS